jgi:hypothetical protein
VCRSSAVKRPRVARILIASGCRRQSLNSSGKLATEGRARIREPSRRCDGALQGREMAHLRRAGPSESCARPIRRGAEERRGPPAVVGSHNGIGGGPPEGKSRPFPAGLPKSSIRWSASRTPPADPDASQKRLGSARHGTGACGQIRAAAFCGCGWFLESEVIQRGRYSLLR